MSKIAWAMKRVAKLRNDLEVPKTSPIGEITCVLSYAFEIKTSTFS